MSIIDMAKSISSLNESIREETARIEDITCRINTIDFCTSESGVRANAGFTSGKIYKEYIRLHAECILHDTFGNVHPSEEDIQKVISLKTIAIDDTGYQQYVGELVADREHTYAEELAEREGLYKDFKRILNYIQGYTEELAELIQD